MGVAGCRPGSRMALVPCIAISTGYILLVLFLCELARKVIAPLNPGLVKTALNEAIAAADLCGCCFELIIIADNYGLAAYGLYLFLLTIWWSMKWGDATACPYNHFEECVQGNMSRQECSAHCGSNPRRNRCFQGDSNSLGSRNRRDPCWSLPLRSLQCVLGGLDRTRSARRDHRRSCHPHLSSWISSCCSQRTSVRNGHRQLHRHLDGVRGVLHQRWLPQPRPRNLPQVRMQGPHPDGALCCLLGGIQLRLSLLPLRLASC